jgi:hypothetical protein
MKKFIVYAERVMSEALEIEAENLEQAYELAWQADNSEWASAQDIHWQITHSKELEA